MRKNKTPHRNPLLKVLLGIVIFVIGIPFLIIAISFIGRIDSETVLPGEYISYIHMPNPVSSLGRLLEHKALEEVLSDPALSDAAPLALTLKDSRIFQNPFIRLAGNGDINGTLAENGDFIFCWDSGFLSPLLRLAPMVIARMTIPGLYYVQAGNLSRFEYRPEAAETVYAGFYHNLVIVSNSQENIESILANTIETDSVVENKFKEFSWSEYDAGIQVKGSALLSAFQYKNPKLNEILTHISPGDIAEAAVQIDEETLQVRIKAGIVTRLPELNTILSRDSHVPGILDILPSTTQYATIMSMASIEELVRLASILEGPQLETTLKRADTASRLLLRTSVDDILYSWTGDETVAFGLEGRPKPVFAVRISDENQRKKVFDTLLSSFALSADNTVILDGVRIPRIRMPDFLSTIMGIWDIHIPTPYYLVEDGFLLLSQSPENLLETVTARRRNTTLVRSNVWKQLSSKTSDRAGLSLFYSLDRSIPFFLKGTDAMQRILSLYSKGLARLSIQNGDIYLTLSALSSHSDGPAAVAKFPIESESRLGGKVFGLVSKKDDNSRIMYIENRNTVISRNPANDDVYTYEDADPLWIVPYGGALAEDFSEPALWALSEGGTAALLNANLETASGFPLATGLRISSEPSVHEGKLYMAASDATLWRLDKNGSLEQIDLPFSQILRSPPSFGAHGRKSIMAMYPKSFSGEIWVMDLDGKALEGWPAKVTGIAYGSPLLFKVKKDIRTAFLTQAGDLNVYDIYGEPVPGFPIRLPGVFYLQPKWDGIYLWTLASDGTVFRIGMDGAYDSRKIDGLSAKTGAVVPYDTNSDDTAELFFTGEGNLLYGYTNDFSPLPGLPVKGWGTPWFGDINKDRKTECIIQSLDNKLYGWQFR